MVWLGVVVGVYLVLLLAVSLISIHPYRIPFYISPGTMGAPQEEVEFTSEDGVLLRGWWVPAEGATRVVILAHGYMMNRCELTPEAYFLWKQGISCLLIDLRAHGKSKGPCCTLGHKERMDVKAAAAFARGRSPGAKLGFIGSSMGSAAGALALGDDSSLFDMIVLDSTFGRLPSAILGWWRFVGGAPLAFALSPLPLLAWPLAGVNPFTIDISESVKNFGGTPVLFFHGTRDNLALPSEAERNIAMAPESTVVWFEDCGHSEGRWEQPEKYREALSGFLRSSGFL